MRRLLFLLTFLLPIVVHGQHYRVLAHDRDSNVINVQLYESDGVTPELNLSGTGDGLDIRFKSNEGPAIEFQYLATATDFEVITDVEACIQDDGGAFTDDTTDCNDAGANDVAYPATPVNNDRLLFGYGGTFDQLTINVGTPGVGTYTIAWSYWNGSAWSALTVVDNTSGFQVSGSNVVAITVPTNWATTTVNSQGPFYYVRATIDGGTHTTDPLISEVDVGFGNFSAPSTNAEMRFEHVSDGLYELHTDNGIWDQTNSTGVTMCLDATGTMSDCWYFDQNVAEFSNFFTTNSGETFGSSVAGSVVQEIANNATVTIGADDIDSVAFATSAVDEIAFGVINELAWFNSTVGTVNSQTSFVLDDPISGDDDSNNWLICIDDDSVAGVGDCEYGADWDNGTSTLTIDAALHFTVEIGDNVRIMPATQYSNNDTVAGTDVVSMTAGTVDSILDEVVETAGATYTMRCILAALMAEAAGEWSQSGAVATFQDSGGNSNRVVGTIGATSRTSITITCP